jgi:hypothetical protein
VQKEKVSSDGLAFSGYDNSLGSMLLKPMHRFSALKYPELYTHEGLIEIALPLWK